MTNIKIRGGTPDHSEDLCRTCTNGMRMQGEKGVATMCNALDQPFRVTGKIHDCTRYVKRTNEPNIYMMYEQCWYRIRLKDGRETFATQYGQKMLERMGFLFNEQAENIRQLTKLYNLEEVEGKEEAEVVRAIR